jgi:hypothetical protein
MERENKANMIKEYQSPKVLHHQAIKFETAISPHYEFKEVSPGCWQNVWVEG